MAYHEGHLQEEDQAPVILLMATHGEGEPTDNAVEFYKWANDKERDEERPFGGLRYAVFALGNTQYEHFCYMGKWVDEKMRALGATCVHELGLGDDDANLGGIARCPCGSQCRLSDPAYCTDHAFV